ncbi:ParB/RepB/Spo0J family partition protein [Clavibacter michiganensis subsp. michiganensis]|uniref:ParB/RepB/Spo0J family partition protein n=1 Tax=Clavibacter michiganensis TaxID=28447 RepID=UPI001C654299|nr:ParB/RepB/Spo0J family partition protein [Clavibacter michiganensis]MBW8025313.1 ParB/RepB/Spo0J family partition protein [Clavibacter michiganensis subsp. michiganensis]
MTTTPPDVAPSSRLEHVAPKSLVFGTNVRLDEKIDRTFVSSIKQHGVLTPISVTEDEDGTMTVLLGNRRTRAALEAGLATIPAYVIPVLPGEAERIVDQIVENDQRAGLDPAEHAHAYQQLALIGMSADGIRRKTNAPKGRVEQGLAIAGSEAASTAAREHQLTFDQAAAIAEFEGDTATVAELTAFARDRPDQILHAAMRKRQEREREADEKRIHELIAERGIRIVEDITTPDRSCLELKHLYHDEELTRPVIFGEVHTHPGLVATVEWDWIRKEDDTGFEPDRAPVAKYGIDGWATATRPDGETPAFYVRDDMKPKGRAGTLTEDELAERRATKENTKQWVASTEVRRIWIRDLLQRRTLPSDHATVTALALAHGDIQAYRHHDGALELLQLTAAHTDNGNSIALRKELASRPDRAAHLAVAIAVSAIERTLDDRKGWQEAIQPGRWFVPLYLRTLGSWGYPLSDIEQHIITGEVKA